MIEHIDRAVCHLAEAGAKAIADHEDYLHGTGMSEEYIETSLNQYRHQIGAWLLNALDNLHRLASGDFEAPSGRLN